MWERGRRDCLHGPSHRHTCPQKERAAVVAVAPDQREMSTHLIPWLTQGTAPFVIGCLSSGHGDLSEGTLRLTRRVTRAAPDVLSPHRRPLRDHEPHGGNRWALDDRGARLAHLGRVCGGPAGAGLARSDPTCPRMAMCGRKKRLCPRQKTRGAAGERRHPRRTTERIAGTLSRRSCM